MSGVRFSTAWTFLRIAAKDCFRPPRSVLAGRGPSAADRESALREALDWLRRAQDASGSGGVSKNYLLGTGWNAPYPETTGYIIPTFLAWSARSGDQDFAGRAVRMGDWELSVQSEDGGFEEGIWRREGPHRPPIVFNTGMVLKGLVRLFETTRDERFRAGAVRAGAFLLERQDPDGAWRRSVYQGIPHTYHARVAWSLLLLHGIAPDERLQSAATKHYDWVVSTQRENGFFEEARFFPGKLPNTHSLAYTIRGLVEGHAILGNDAWLRSAVRCAIPVRREFERLGHLPGIYRPDWTVAANFDCLTAVAQHALIWYRLETILGDASWGRVADRALDYLCLLQDRTSNNPGVRGSVKGSHPVWGSYAPFQFPNWAVKFFADAMMVRLERQK